MANTRTLPDHTEHHGLAAVPMHQMPDLHRKMPGEVQVTAAGSAAVTKADPGWRL